MKKIMFIIFAVTLLGLFSAGCTADDPAYFSIDDSGPFSVLIVDSSGNIITIDEVTRAITNIEYEHHEIHEGNSFTCWYEQEVSDIGDKSIISFRTTNSARWLHITVTTSATFMAEARILEAPAINDNTGASLAVYNRNRNSGTTSTVIDTSQNPDVTGQATYFTELTMGNVVGGTEISHEHLGTGEGKKTLGGMGRGGVEWILKPNTLYAVEVESTTNDDNVHVIELNWYEHTNR